MEEIYNVNEDGSKTIGILKVAKANNVVEAVSELPDLSPLYDQLWYEEEVSCLYASTNLGKSILAVQIANEIAKEYEIAPKKAASILDTFSCVFQAILPYGAQMLVAISAVSALGMQISAVEIIPKLFYPYFLCFRN